MRTLIDRNGGHQRTITGPVRDVPPALVADGARLAFGQFNATGSGLAVFTISATGRDVRRLTPFASPGRLPRLLTRGHHDHVPRRHLRPTQPGRGMSLGATVCPIRLAQLRFCGACGGPRGHRRSLRRCNSNRTAASRVVRSDSFVPLVSWVPMLMGVESEIGDVQKNQLRDLKGEALDSGQERCARVVRSRWERWP